MDDGIKAIIHFCLQTTVPLPMEMWINKSILNDCFIRK